MKGEFETKYLKLNGSKVRAIIPKREISLEEAIAKSRKILKS